MSRECPRERPPSARLQFQVKAGAGWSRQERSFVSRVCWAVRRPPRTNTGAPGVTQKLWGADGQRTCTGLQRESGAGGKSSPTKESLSSQNATLISPVIIARIDEDKSKGKHPSLPMQSPIPQPSACHTEQPLPHHGSANVTRAFLVLPNGLAIQASLEGTMSPPDSPAPNQCPRQKRGFASITVTARRVPVGSGQPARGPGAGREPNAASPTSGKVPAALGHWAPSALSNQCPSPLKTHQRCLKSGEKPPKQLSDPGLQGDGVGLPSSGGREEVPPSFISRVQLQVSQRCPSAVYYLDKSLNVCIDRPRVKCQKTYRSTLSFRLKCSLSALTADGVDGIANGEPMEETAPAELPGAHRAPLGSRLSPDFPGKKVIQRERTKEGRLGGKYPLQSVCASGLAAFVDIPRGPHNGVATKKEEDEQAGSHHAVFPLQIPHSRDEAGTQMLWGSRKRSSTTAPGFLPDAASREAVAAPTDGSSKRTDPSKDTSKKAKEIQAQGVPKPKMSVSNSVCNMKASSGILREENVRRQNQLLKSADEFRGWRGSTKEPPAEEERERGRRVALARVALATVTLPRVTLPRARSPGVAWGKNALTWPEANSQLEKTPAAPWTLREALEIHNPQFISRSRERLKRLEHMVQLRRAQHREAAPSTPGALVRRLSSTSTSSKKRQFTIPDPLSDNLFKPKERFIPEKEMHMRSKRIYDNLPEVKKKQEEKQKRIIIQSNRLRVEMFKKQLLDQLLHRNTE